MSTQTKKQPSEKANLLSDRFLTMLMIFNNEIYEIAKRDGLSVAVFQSITILESDVSIIATAGRSTEMGRLKLVNTLIKTQEKIDDQILKIMSNEE